MKPCNHRVVATTSQLIEKPGRQVILTNLISVDLYFQTQLQGGFFHWYPPKNSKNFEGGTSEKNHPVL